MADPVVNAENFTSYNSYLQSDQQRQLANDLATQEYNAKKAAGESETRALEAAKFAWEQVKDRANFTGRFEDSWTFPSQKFFTEQFGQWMPGGPTAGQQTLAAQQQLASNLGTYQGAQTLSAQQQAWNQANAAAQAAAAATGYWQQPTGTGNIVMDAFTTRASPQEMEQYLAQAGGNRQAAAQNFFNDVQGAVRARTEAAGAQFTPDTMRQWTYGQGIAGQEGGPWGGGGQRTLSAQEQDYTQWLRAAQEARANQTAQQQQAMSYLTLLSNLRGPADWAKYQQVLGAGGNMNALAAAAMGQYVPGGGATSGYQPQAANLQTMMADVQGTGQQGYNAFTPGGQIQQAAAQQPQQNNQQVNAMGGGTNTMGAQQQPQNRLNLPAPNQIAPQTWNNLAPSQKSLIEGEYESQGWNVEDVRALMNQSLPKYASNAPGAGTWRLR
jgi:hypothetical protein